MKRTLIYRHWSEEYGAVPGVRGFRNRVTKAVAGEDGVEDFYTNAHGMTEIRMSDPDAGEYWVPAHEVLGLLIERD